MAIMAIGVLSALPVSYRYRYRYRYHPSLRLTEFGSGMASQGS